MSELTTKGLNKNIKFLIDYLAEQQQVTSKQVIETALQYYADACAKVDERIDPYDIKSGHWKSVD